MFNILWEKNPIFNMGWQQAAGLSPLAGPAGGRYRSSEGGYVPDS
jgi:hypothetical protein